MGAVAQWIDCGTEDRQVVGSKPTCAASFRTWVSGSLFVSGGSLFVSAGSLFVPGGSFRQFLWQVAQELESPLLHLLILSPASAGHRKRGRYILKPGPMTYSEEKMLQFFGQVI